MLLLCLCFAGCKEKTVVESDYLPIADPYVMLYEGKYYAYGTGGTVEGEGFACFSSDDLKNWTREGQALSAADSYGTWGFWAPEVCYIESKKKFYLFYSTEEHICVATADTPQGPFRQEVKQPIWDEKSIDTSLFIDDDGTPYLYFVRFTDGNVIWVAEMNDDLTGIKQETLTECIKVGEPWELSQDKPAKVAEGPSVLKKEGIYYLIYSANHFESKNYGVGYATSDSPMGPWKKYEENPILQRADGLMGTGHGAPFRCKDGSWKYIFHAHWDSTKVQPRTSYIKDFAISDQRTVSIGGPLIRPQVLTDNLTSKWKKGLFYYMLIACLCACQKKAETISTASLLKEMVDCEALAKYPEPYYETRQFSSYDRASVKKDSVSWYANCDRSQFLRVDSIDGRREFVLVDTDGPGAITRFWVTVAAYSDKGTLRFYLDNQEVPEIEGEVLGILSGHALVDAPLSASVSELTDYKQRGHNLYLPIPYAKHCKITYESPSIKEPGEFSEECFYYNINYRTYAEGTSVATFSKEDIKQNAKLLADVQRKLTVSRREIGGLQKEPMLRSVLAAGEERDMTLSGPGAVRRLDVKLHAGDFDQALRSTVLRISFDGNETVWVPVGDFFGAGTVFLRFRLFIPK